MPGTAMQNAIAVVGINIGKNRSRYWITDVQKQPEKTSIARRKLLAGGVVLAGGAASAALSTASAGAADDNLPPHVPAWMKERGAPFLSPMASRQRSRSCFCNSVRQPPRSSSVE
jgi:hypothetical protein